MSSEIAGTTSSVDKAALPAVEIPSSKPSKRKFDEFTFRDARDRFIFQTRHMYPPTAKEYFDQAGHYYEQQKQQIDQDLMDLESMRKKMEDHAKHIMWKYADMTRASSQSLSLLGSPPELNFLSGGGPEVGIEKLIW